MLYNLYKNIYELNRNKKEYLLNNFDNIVESMKNEGDDKIVVASNIVEAKKVLSKNEVFKEVLASGVHDPETPKEMKKLVDLLEKYIRIDDNICHENISVFLSPMSMSSKKINIRPCRLVGLMRRLDRLSRRYNKEKKSGNSSLWKIKEEFKKTVSEIKERLD
jgi:hypothetical protein